METDGTGEGGEGPPEGNRDAAKLAFGILLELVGVIVVPTHHYYITRRHTQWGKEVGGGVTLRDWRYISFAYTSTHIRAHT